VKKMGHILDRVAYISGYISGWVLLLMMMLILVEVVTRYAMRHPLILADEMSAYMLVFISIVGLAYTQSVKGHIRINFLVNFMKPQVRSWLRVATLTIFLIYSCIATVVSYDLVIQAFERGMKSNTYLMTPWWIPMLGIPLGFTILSISLLAEVFRRVIDVRAGIDIEAPAETDKVKEVGV